MIAAPDWKWLMRTKQLFFLLMTGACASEPNPAKADTPAPPKSYKRVTSDGSYVFVMIADVSLEEEVRHWNEETGQGIREIREKYSQSGMYRNDGSTKPLWTVDWHAGVEIASNGVHLIRHGPWATSTEGEAISFFADGKLLRMWYIRELVDAPELLKHTVSHFFWIRNATMDDTRLEYSISTEDGNRFVFDMRTGQVIHTSRSTLLYKVFFEAHPTLPIAIGLIAVACGVFAVVLVRRKRKRAIQPAPIKT
jgi:hypothetical protein